MKAKSSAHYQREYRRRLREAGFVKKEVWILPENAKLLSRCERALRLASEEAASQIEINLKGDTVMSDPEKSWTTESLFDALEAAELFSAGRAQIEMIDGIEPAIHITMREYGDLPIFVTVSGEQILAEALLWPTDDVKDVAALNETILRTHKYFPLSTISLDYVGNGTDNYHMFGALSSASVLANVVFEIEVLASNVIQATEAYSDYLKVTKQATA